MSEQPEQFPKRKPKGNLEIRHRAGTGAGKEDAAPMKVERVVKKGMELEGGARRRRRRRGAEEAAPPWQLGVLVLAGVVVLGVVVVALWYAVIRKGKTPVAVEPPMVRRDGPVVEAEVSRFVTEASPAELAESIETTVRGFMDAETNEERCRWVRGGSKMLPKMEEFYARTGNVPPDGFGEIVGRFPLAFGGVPAEVITVEEEGSDVNHVFSLLPGRDRMLIDWESAVAYGELSWEKLLEERPVEPVQLRVFLKLDNYYNFEFSDEEKWQCLRLKTRSVDEMLYAYVERNSVVGRRVLGALGSDVVVPMNLRVKFLPGARERDMVVVDELIHPYWLRDDGLEETLQVE